MTRHRHYPILDDADWLIHQYVDLERTTTDIAKEVGCTPAVVCRSLRQSHVPLRGRPPTFTDDELLAWHTRFYNETGETSLNKYRDWAANKPGAPSRAVFATRGPQLTSRFVNVKLQPGDSLPAFRQPVAAIQLWLYYESTMSMSEVADVLNLHISNISRNVRLHGRGYKKPQWGQPPARQEVLPDGISGSTWHLLTPDVVDGVHRFTFIGLTTPTSGVRGSKRVQLTDSQLELLIRSVESNPDTESVFRMGAARHRNEEWTLTRRAHSPTSSTFRWFDSAVGKVKRTVTITDEQADLLVQAHRAATDQVESGTVRGV